jgi:quercetin dioxygenase-like cupin family protein
MSQTTNEGSKDSQQGHDSKAGVNKSKPRAETVLQSDAAWNGKPYAEYPTGRAQLTVLRITIPPHSTLPWHSHVVPNAAYVVKGQMTLEDKETGEKHTIKAGEACCESTGVVHRGLTGDEAVEVIVTYAGTKATPLSVPEDPNAPEFG